MQKYLVIRTQYFFDGHGSPDKGSIYKFVTTDNVYTLLKSSSFYSEEVESYDKLSGEEKTEFLEDCERSGELGAEDGYNCSVFSYEYRAITDEEADRITEIILNYERI